MKNFPLSFQIWLVFSGVTLLVFLLLVIFLPWNLRVFFTEQIYQIIQTSQSNFPSQQVLELLKETKGNNSDETLFKLKLPADFSNSFPVVKHVLILKKPQQYEVLFPHHYAPFIRDHLEGMVKEAMQQEKARQRYSLDIGNRTLFYIISKEVVKGEQIYLISYSWADYRNSLVTMMFWRLALLVFLLFILSWLPAAFWLAKYLSKPLVEMQHHIEQLSEGKWDEPFKLERHDEIGKLAQAFENMRQRLIRQDQAQQSLLQNISHDLKTPVMVIRSFVQAIQDGIFPKGSLEESIATIDSEAQRLEKRIRNLLYVNKIHYLKGRELQLEPLDLSEVIKKQVERICWQRPELTLQIDIPKLIITGDREQWEIALENLLDNQIRYASQKITLTKVENSSHQSEVVIRIWNDGPPIEPRVIDNIFERYSTGKDGEFGLGLAIVYHILSVHGAKIWVRNEEGVAFYLEIKTR